MPEQARRRQLLRDGALTSIGLRAAWVLGAQLSLDLRFAHAASLLGVRFWPGPDYSRLTVEVDAPLRATERRVGEPPELIVDIEALESPARLQALLEKTLRPDALLQSLWIQARSGGVTRLRFTLAPGTNPQVFTLPPAGRYRHRLVVDLYPGQRVDPLQALLREHEQARRAANPAATPAERSSAAGGSQPRRGRNRSDADPLFVVAVDAGHGGEDPGAIGPGGTYEKDVVLAIARELRTLINAEPGMRAYMTRTGDYFVPLGARVQRARRVRADIFVSVHADAYPEPRPRGASVYVLSERGASSTTARWLASRENSSDEIGGVNLASRDREVRRVLLEMSTAAQIRESSLLASDVLNGLGRVGHLHKPQVEQASFAVLRAPDMPSVLVETAFISNPVEERRLADPEHQRRIAAAILEGIRHYRGRARTGLQVAAGSGGG
jgi:N-acetylmuramoyl-L-alanine amidase